MEISRQKTVWYAVVNIYAASKSAGKMWLKAERCLQKDGILYTAAMTGTAGNAMALTCNACNQGYRNFIAVGGDGTVHDVLEGILFYISSREVMGERIHLSDFTLAVVPLGSGNDWIKTAGVPKDMEDAVALFRSGKRNRQDVVKVTTLDPSAFPQEKSQKISYMANVGGVGIDARVCEIVNREKKKGKRGKFLYIRALLYCIKHRYPVYARVLCDGKTVFDGAYFSIAFGIGKYSGGGMRQTPDAVLDDGLLDMTIIPELPMMRIAKEAPKLFTDKFATVKELTLARGRKYMIYPYSKDDPSRTAQGELVEVDGEVLGNAPVKLEVLPEQINILTR